MKKTLDVAYWDQDTDKPVFVGKFTNNYKGFQAIQRKIEERSKNIDAIVIHLVMEPSGGYEQPFAHFAHQAGWRVSLPNPLYPRRWAESRGKRAKTDPQDARNLAHFGFVNDPFPWKPLPPEVEQLSHLLDSNERIYNNTDPDFSRDLIPVRLKMEITHSGPKITDNPD